MEPLPGTAELPRELSSTSDLDLETAIRRLADAVAAIVPSSVGISLTLADSALTFTLVAYSQIAAELDAAQDIDGGPCVDTALTGADFTVGDMLAEDRWQHFATAAAHVRSSLSMPRMMPGSDRARSPSTPPTRTHSTTPKKRCKRSWAPASSTRSPTLTSPSAPAPTPRTLPRHWTTETSSSKPSATSSARTGSTPTAPDAHSPTPPIAPASTSPPSPSPEQSSAPTVPARPRPPPSQPPRLSSLPRGRCLRANHCRGCARPTNDSRRQVTCCPRTPVPPPVPALDGPPHAPPRTTCAPH